MSKFLVILTILFSLNLNSAEAAGGGFLKALIQLFKGSGNKGVSITDDVMKNVGKNTDDVGGILGDDISRIRNLDETYVSYKDTIADEQFILQKIGKNDHTSEFISSVSRSKRKFKDRLTFKIGNRI